MKQLYQTLTPLFTPPLTNPKFVMLRCPEFLIKLTLDETPPGAENHFCFMDYYQLKQINLLKQIGIKAYSSYNGIL